VKELFKDYHEALTFAFLYSTQQYAISPMAKMMKTGLVGTGKGLVSLDGAAQAGMIKAAIDKLQPLEKSFLVAKYSPKFDVCPCCGGQKPLQQYSEAIAALRDWATNSFSGLSVKKMREGIVRAYFERDISIGKLADELKVPRRTAYDQRKKIHDALRTLETHAGGWAFAMLESLFEGEI
jgi:hypothetical protein